MRLLHISGDAWGDDPLDISLRFFIGTDIPPYMILSHRWRDDEVLFEDMTGAARVDAQAKKGYSKLETSCRIALQQKLEYAWLDTCCIDKTSSAELSEAINSMYTYYAQAQICYAFLDDVKQITSSPDDVSMLASCAWFTRGWTLQELIAPREVYFYSMDWVPLGTKSSLCRKISKVSNISMPVLRDPDMLAHVCVSEKMSWAAERSTTRPEDEAYALMGIFGVQMPPLYGEGRQNAFRRLQLQIMQSTVDHSIFAWDADTVTGDMLAPTVKCFIRGRDYGSIEPDALPSLFRSLKPDFNMTNFGLHIELPLWKVRLQGNELHLALLGCFLKSDSDRLHHVGVYLQNINTGRSHRFHRAVLGGSSLRSVPSLNMDWRPPESPGPMWIALKPQATTEVAVRPGILRPAYTWSTFVLQWEASQHYDQIYWHRGRRISERYVPWESTWVRRDIGTRVFRQSHHFTTALEEVICSEGENAVLLAFGVANNDVWVHMETARGDVCAGDLAYEELLAHYHFPTGTIWQKPYGRDPTFISQLPSPYYTSLQVGNITWRLEVLHQLINTHTSLGFYLRRHESLVDSP
jgi:hypothetical protein